MKTAITVCFLFISLAAMASAELELITRSEAATVFGGGSEKIEVTIRNRGEKPKETQLSTRMFQASSATLMPLGEPKPWKKIQVLAGQTVVEHIELPFPEVRSPILAVDRQTSVAVDIAEQTAAKTALQNAALDLAERLVPALAKSGQAQ